MDDVRELLMDSFEAHEPVVPDSADVLARVDAIARSLRRSRWALRATGVSLVGAGVVAGSVGLPSLLSHDSAHDDGTSVVVGAAGTPSRTYTRADELDAYFSHGYDYNNAVALAKIWNYPHNAIDRVKARAGLELLEGRTLPVAPDNPPQPGLAAVNAFFEHGYDYTNAEQLARIWHDSTYQAKIKGGTKLENGETLPVPPTGNSSSSSTPAASPAVASLGTAKARRMFVLRESKLFAAAAPKSAAGDGAEGVGTESPALTAYFDAGYDYTNAEQLARIWHETDITRIKAKAGKKLLAGDTLPVKPDGTPASPENKAVDAFFAAGYDYNDAVKLGKMWNESSYQAKIDGGQRLERGQSLPIQPGS